MNPHTDTTNEKSVVALGMSVWFVCLPGFRTRRQKEKRKKFEQEWNSGMGKFFRKTLLIWEK